MTKRLFFTTVLSFTGAFALITGCKKEFDTPPLKTDEAGAELFISHLKTKVATSGKNYRFTNDSSLYCTVIADESSGNIYKQLFARDDAGDAIQLNLATSGGIYTGDRLRINLNGLYVINSNNMIYLDSINIIKNTVKISSGNTVNPIEISLQMVLSQTKTGKSSPQQSQLIRIPAVEFTPNYTCTTFADPISKTTIDQTLKDCNGNHLLVRTSGFANFASKQLPTGNGYIMGILTQYNDKLQLTIRNYNEITMQGVLCSVTNPTVSPSVLYLKKDFNDNNINSGGWASYAVTNNAVNWSVSNFSGTATPFAKISGFVNGANAASETWYISSSIDLSLAQNPYLVFQTAAKYPGPLLEVLVSDNYSGGAPANSEWISLAGSYTLSPAPSSGGYVWTPSGKINLANFKEKPVRIAFKYSSTTSGATTYELDDIVVQED